MARAHPADDNALPNPSQNLALGIFSLLKAMDFYIFKNFVILSPEHTRAGVPTLRPCMWARLSSQDVLPAGDIPGFVGSLHIPSTCGSLGTFPLERSPWQALHEGQQRQKQEGGSTFPGEQGWRALGSAPV